jgi:peptide methionine sulfoxide reductase MsrA
MTKKAVLAGGCFWGELVRGTSARLIVVFCEVLTKQKTQ